MYGLNSDEYYTNYIAELERELSKLSALNADLRGYAKGLKNELCEKSREIRGLEKELKDVRKSLEITIVEMSLARQSVGSLEKKRAKLEKRIEALDID